MALSINPNVSRDILVETQAATTREGFEESQTAMTRCMFNEKQKSSMPETRNGRNF